MPAALGLRDQLRESLAAHINAFVPKDGRIELDPEDADGQTLLVWFRTIASSQSGYVQPAVRIECGAKSYYQELDLIIC